MYARGARDRPRVNLPRDEILADAALTRDEHLGVTGGHAADQRQDVVHLRAGIDQRAGTFAAASAESAGTDGNDTLLTKPSRSATRAAIARRRPTPKVWSGAVTWNLSKAGALSERPGWRLTSERNTQEFRRFLPCLTPQELWPHRSKTLAAARTRYETVSVRTRSRQGKPSEGSLYYELCHGPIYSIQAIPAL
jgi:hypothetical protein